VDQKIVFYQFEKENGSNISRILIKYEIDKH